MLNKIKNINWRSIQTFHFRNAMMIWLLSSCLPLTSRFCSLRWSAEALSSRGCTRKWFSSPNRRPYNACPSYEKLCHHKSPGKCHKLRRHRGPSSIWCCCVRPCSRRWRRHCRKACNIAPKRWNRVAGTCKLRSKRSPPFCNNPGICCRHNRCPRPSSQKTLPVGQTKSRRGSRKQGTDGIGQPFSV